jgi:hypothetical protein
MTIKEIEKAVISLPPGELAEFAEWFEEFRAEVWDKQIEKDLKQGSLEHLISEAEADFEAGRCESL